MLGISRNIGRKRARIAVSIMAALALIMPTVPFSSIAAHGEELDASSPTAIESAAEPIANYASEIPEDLANILSDEYGLPTDIDAESGEASGPINELEDFTDEGFDAARYDAISYEGASESSAGMIAAAHPQHIYVTLPLTYGDDYAFTVNASYEPAAYCGNCLDEDGEVAQAEMQRTEELDAIAEEALKLAEEHAASSDEMAALFAEELEGEPFSDPVSKAQPTSEPLDQDDLIIQPSLKGGSAVRAQAPRATSAQHPDYSLKVTLKDITGFDNANSQDGSTLFMGGSDATIYIGSTGNEDSLFRTYNMGIIRSYAFPTFSSTYFGLSEYDNPNNPRYNNVAMKMQMPIGKDEEAQGFELMYGTRTSSAYVRPNDNQWPTINDNTVRANFANTEGYDASRIVAYQNAYKLAPFASYADIIKSGNAIPASNPLASKVIRESWPIHETDGMKLGLAEGDEESLVRYMVYFTDGTHMVSDIEYLGTRNLAASYVDSATGMLYQPDFWLIGEAGKVGVDFIANFIRSKTWANYFNPVLSKMNPAPDFNRIVKDHFDEKIHERAEEVAMELINLMDDWAPTASSHRAWRAILNSSINKSPANNVSNQSAEPIMLNLLFFYTVYDRLFGMDIGGSEELGARNDANIFKVMAFRGGVINPGLSLKTMTKHMNYSKMFGLSQLSRLTTQVFPTCVGELTGISDPQTLIERAVKRTTDYTDMNNWFADYMNTFCFYKEYKPDIKDPSPELAKLTWRGWDQIQHYPNDMVFLMTVKEPGSMYMMSSPICLRFGSTHVYSANVEFNDTWRDYFIGRMDNTGLPEARYSASLTSICEAAQLNKICILGIDQVVSKLDGGTSWLDSEKLWGKTLTVDPFHKGYTDPMMRCQRSSQGAAIMTVNTSLVTKLIYYFTGQLSSPWVDYQSHEIAHALDNDVYLRGSRRAGTEDYTDGLLTQYYGSQIYTMNLSQDLAMTSDASANFTRERISTKEKLNDYYGKMYEAYDTLDYAMLKAFLKLDKDEQNAVAMQLQYSGRDGSSEPDVGANAVTFIPRNTVLQNYDGTDATTPVTSSQFIDGTRKFQTVEEVYDNQLVLFPGGTGSFTWIQALYVSTNLAGVYWHPIHANNNFADSRSFKVQMYRMLGRHGYDAFSNFGRAGGGNDLAKLQALTGCSSFREWQLNRWNEIEAGKDSLAYVDFDQLVDKFVDAMRADAAGNDRKLTQMVNLRWRTYYLMKRITNDFRYSLHTDAAAPVTPVRTVADLQAIMDNPFGNYVLMNDIDVSNVVPAKTNALLAGTFYGKLDGGGHNLISTSAPLLPLFEGAKHAYIKDVNLEGGTSTVMAATVNNVEFENISFTMFERNINNMDDFLLMDSDLAAGVHTFHLNADLDFTNWSIANAAKETPSATVIATMVKGTQSNPIVFNGNGHTISGLSGASLFERAINLHLSELDFENCSNLQPAASGDGVSLVAKRTHLCTFDDLYFDNVSLSGRYRVGLITGDDGFIGPAGNNNRIQGSRFNRIQVNNGAITLGDSTVSGSCCYGGFIAGRVFNSDLQDISVRGTFTTFGVSCGGVIGTITGSSRLDRCISLVDFNAKYAGNNGVLLGDIESDSFDASKTSISNSVALGSTGGPTSNGFGNDNVGRFAKFAANAKSVFHNCYENADNRYGASLSFDEDVDVSFVRTVFMPDVRVQDDKGFYYNLSYYYKLPHLLNNEKFYLDLGFDNEVWNYAKTISKGFPVLRVPSGETPRDEYDLDAHVDFENEQLVITGADHDAEKTTINNIYIQIPRDNGNIKKGTWYKVDRATKFSLIAGEPDKLDISNTIDYEKYLEYPEVADLGYWTVALAQTASVSGKAYDYERLVTIPKRPDMVYADALMGIRADSKGNGAIRLVSIGSYDAASKLEYRRVADEDSGEEVATMSLAATSDKGVATQADETEEIPWIPMTSTNTTVPAGTYEVRTAATDSSFASHPTRVTVAEYDPAAVIFPLVLDPKGGNWAEGFTAPLEYNNEEDLALPTAEGVYRNGYEFTGWYESEACTGTPVTSVPKGKEGAYSLYAGWKALTYDVTLNLNGGRLKDGEGVTRYTAGNAVTLPTPVRAARTFVGWYDNEACEGEPVKAITAADYGNKQFWAKWESIYYALTLHANGGELAEGIPLESQYEFGTGVSLPKSTDITRTGYAFTGWYDNKDGLGSPVAAVTASDTGSKEFWASWKLESYNVTLMKNGGSVAPTSTDITSYQYGEAVTLPQLERPGYTFDGWHADAAMIDGTVKEIPAGSTGDKAFYAAWSPNTYTIEYDMGSDAEGNHPPAIDLDAYETYTVGTGLSLPDAQVMVWEDHVFAGWYDNAELTGAPLTAISTSDYGDLILHARWLGDACVVSYYTNGGSFSEEPKTIYDIVEGGFQLGDAIELPAAATLKRDGYAFEGWFDNAELTGSALASVALTERNTSLYAKWKAVDYAIAYDLGGGHWAEGFTPRASYNVQSGSIALPASSALARAGHSFTGWYDNAALQGTPVAEIAPSSTGDKTFYASWKRDEYVDPTIPDNPVDEVLHIDKIEIKGVTGIPAITFDADNYAMVTMPREQMPKTEADFNIQVPDEVTASIYKRESFVLQWLSRSDSDVWHIRLTHKADSNRQVFYTLEIVPQEVGTDPGRPTIPNDPNQPQTPTGNGSGNGSGGTGGAGGNGGGSIPSVSGNATPTGNAVGSQLARTGDHAPTPFAFAMGIGFLALAGMLLSYRRYLQIR